MGLTKPTNPHKSSFALSHAGNPSTCSAPHWLVFPAAPHHTALSSMSLPCECGLTSLSLPLRSFQPFPLLSGLPVSASPRTQIYIEVLLTQWWSFWLWLRWTRWAPLATILLQTSRFHLKKQTNSKIPLCVRTTFSKSIICSWTSLLSPFPAIDTSATTNMGMDVSLRYTDWESFGCIPCHGIAGSHVTPSAFLKDLHTDFYSDGIHVHSHQ